MKHNYLQGFYVPQHKDKYIGNSNNIVYRSSYELKFFRWLDYNPQVLKWNSEDLKIPYINPFDGKIHYYYVDVIFQYVNVNKEIRTALAEIKPSDQCEPPKPPKKRLSSSYKQKVKTFIINQAKWEAAKKFASENNMLFLVVTEKQLEALR